MLSEEFCLVQVTKEVFEAAKGRLKVVGRAGVGVDNVDLQAATEVFRCSLSKQLWDFVLLKRHMLHVYEQLSMKK